MGSSCPESLQGMNSIDKLEKALVATRELLSLITPEEDSGNEDTFSHRSLKFLQSATATLQKMPQKRKKEVNALFNSVLSITGLIAQNLSPDAAFDVVVSFSREVGGLLEDNLPEDIARSYDELQRLLDDASQKMKNIQTSCYKLMEEVKAVSGPVLNI